MSLVICLQRLNKGKRVFSSEEIQELQALAKKNRETMESAQAEATAVQSLLDEAQAELAEVEGLIREAAPALAVAPAPEPAKAAPEEVAAAYPPAEAQETTDAQRQQAADHAKDLGGRVVWQRGDLALIEGYSLLSGDSVYIAANGSQRTRVDIKSYTGKGYTEAQKAELMKARADAVRAADELLARNPDGPFADGPLVFADDIPAAVQGVVRGWIGLLGLDGARIVVTTPASGAAMADGMAGKFRRIGKASLSGDNTNGTMQPLGGDDFHIAVRPGVSTLKALEVMAHELGHIVERRAFAQASAGTQQAIRDAHAAWLKENGNGRALDMAQAMRAYRSGQTTGFSEDAKATEAGAYWRSFGEWFADQVSRWATTETRPVGVVEQFFKRLADRLRVFFTGERAKFKPDATVAQWLDSLAKDVPPAEEVAAAYPAKEQPAAAPVEQKQPQAPAEVENFGEQLPPARRNMAAKLAESLTDADIANKPLSEIWPLAENEAIEDTFAAAVAHAARAEIPSKPRVAYKVKAWVQKVKMLRDLAGKIVSGAVTKERMAEKIGAEFASLRDWWSKVLLLETVDRAQWKRVGDVMERPDSYTYVDGQQVPAPMVRVEVDGKTHWLRGDAGVEGEARGTLAGNRAGIMALLGGDAPQQRMKFEIRQNTRTGVVFINKEGDSQRRRLMEFPDTAAARKAITEQYDALVAAWEAIKARDNITERDLRSAENRPRAGKDHRQGRDVTPQQFQEQFGFRGGEFGKWVQQGKGDKERQAILNDAYDALMDLADLVGIPPKAISLNGTLGIAFGSRGSGWASAHFEPSNLVINLTKTRGAGALGHEWFHALDNYFSRIRRGGKEAPFTGSQRGYRDDNYITHRPEPLMVHKTQASTPITRGRLEGIHKANPKSGYYNPENWRPDPKHPAGVRPEVEERFAALVQALDKSPMAERAKTLDGIKESGDGYWSRTLERAARAFENYLQGKMQDQGYHNDFLANVVPAQDTGRNPERYPYLLPSELKPISDAFDALFGEMKTREDDAGNVAVFSRPGNATSPYWFSALSDQVEKASMNAGPASAWQSMLKNWISTGKVKADEVEWSGLGDWLGMQQGKVSKAQVAEFLDAKRSAEDDAQFSRANQVPLEASDAVGREFWRKIDNGESFTEQEVLDALATNRTGTVRSPQAVVVPEGQTGVGQSVIRWADEIAGLDGYRTSAAWAGDTFTVYVVPEELAAGADLTDPAQARDKAAVAYAFTPLNGGRYEFSVNDVAPDGEAMALLAERGLLEPAGTPDKPYRRIKIGQTQSRALMQESVRRLALNIGQAPAIFYAQRDTGARAGRADSGREYTAEKVSNRFSTMRGGPNRGVPMADAKAVVARIRAALPTAPPVRLLETIAQAPKALRDDIKASGAENLEAAYHAGEIYVFPRNIASIERMMFVVGHHEIRHHGIRSMLGTGDELGAAMHAMWDGNENLRKLAQAKIDAGLANTRALAVEEALADMDPAEVAQFKGWPRVMAAMRQWLRQVAAKFRTAGLNALADAIEPKTWTDADVARFILKAEGVSKGDTTLMRAGGTVFNRPGDQQEDSGAVYSRPAPSQVSNEGGNPKRTAQDLVNSNGGVFDFNRLGETKQDRLRTIMDASRPGWLGLLTRDQIADVYGKEIPPVKEYDQLTREMENQRSKIAQDADDLYNEWAKLSAETNDKLARLMLDATIYSVHPDGAFTALGKPNDAERRQVHARLKAQYALLGKDAQAIYGKVRDFHKGVLEQLRDALEARIRRQVENGQAKAAALSKVRQTFDAYLKEGPYFPLSRFGDFIVVANRDSDGERVVASYATAGEQAAAARTLEADGFTVKMKTAKSYSRETDGSAGKFIGDVLAVLEKTEMVEATINGTRSDLKNQLVDDVNQLFIKALPDLSYRKHFMHRKGTPGFSSDMMRGFANSAFHAASHIARLNHGDQMTFALQDAFTAIEQAPEGDFNLHSQVLNELTKRHDAALNPNTHPVAAMLNQVGFVMYLGLSPAAGLINMLQTVMVTMPHLGARYGFGAANASLAKALGDITTGAKANAKNGWNAAQSTKLTQDERAMMSALQDEGVIDLTQAHDLSAATGLDTGNVARSKAAFAFARAMKIVGWTFHIPEVMNRQVTALSAYRLEMSKSGDADKAKDAAREAIKRTHFDYSASNRARFMQGNVARVLMQFKQYAQNMTYLLGRAAYQALKGESPEVRSIARRQLVATFGVTWAMAGALGLPGLGAVAGLIAAMVGAFDDRDEPYDWKVEFRNLMADAFGKEVGEVLSHGIPRALLPWDISNRVSLGDLWFRDGSREGQSPREAFATDAANILGPTAGTVLGLYTAADHMARGNWSKATESIVPKFLRDPLKAVREGSEGVTSYNGEPLMDLTGAEVAGRLLGFAPARASEMYEGKAAVMNAKTAVEEKRQSLIGQLAKARIDKDQETAAEVMEEIRAFNQRNPTFIITGPTIAKAIMTRMKNRQNTKDGILLPRTKESLRDIGRFAEVD